MGVTVDELDHNSSAPLPNYSDYAATRNNRRKRPLSLIDRDEGVIVEEPSESEAEEKEEAVL